MLSAPGVLLRGSPAQGKAILGVEANAVTVSAAGGLRVAGGALEASGAAASVRSPGAGALTLVTETTAGGLPNPRRFEFGQQHAAGLSYPQLQTSMAFGENAWLPVQLVVNPLGGGLWLPAGTAYNGLALNTPAPDPDFALSVAGNVRLAGAALVVPGLAAADYADDAQARAAGLPDNALYSNNGVVQVLKPLA